MTIEEQKLSFRKEIVTALNRKIEEDGIPYPSEQLTQFYMYWSEHNEGGFKIRRSKQKTWNTKARINRWIKNNETNFGRKKPTTGNITSIIQNIK